MHIRTIIIEFISEHVIFLLFFVFIITIPVWLLVSNNAYAITLEDDTFSENTIQYLKEDAPIYALPDVTSQVIQTANPYTAYIITSANKDEIDTNRTIDINESNINAYLYNHDFVCIKWSGGSGYVTIESFSDTIPTIPKIVDKKDSLYSYKDMEKDLYQLAEYYNPFCRLISLGKTVDNREIYCLRIGGEDNQFEYVVHAGIHGREYLNCHALMAKAEDLLINYNELIPESTVLYVIPMINPDGVTISQYGTKGIHSQKIKQRLRMILKHIPHKLWKSNANGVDLNRNFPAGFKHTQTSWHRSSENYPGSHAVSEKESKALVTLINSLANLEAVVGLHSSGKIIYWNFNVNDFTKRSLVCLAKAANKITGYSLAEETSASKHNGGFGDWIVYKKDVPCITLETGSGSCPLKFSQFGTIYKKVSKTIEMLINW